MGRALSLLVLELLDYRLVEKERIPSDKKVLATPPRSAHFLVCLKKGGHDGEKAIERRATGCS